MSSPILPLRSLRVSSGAMRPSSGSVRPSVSAGPGGRAQNLSVSRLNQQKERDASAVSMSQVLARKAGQENSRSTSVAHIGQTMTAASTSVSHPGSSVSLNGGDGQSDPGADNRRYAYMRKQMLARKAQEAASARKASAGKD